MRSTVRGEAIFRINSFTEYRRSGLSTKRKLNLAEQLSFSPVRRSSSFPQLTDLTRLGAASIVGSWSRHTQSMGQS